MRHISRLVGGGELQLRCNSKKQRWSIKGQKAVAKCHYIVERQLLRQSSSVIFSFENCKNPSYLFNFIVYMWYWKTDIDFRIQWCCNLGKISFEKNVIYFGQYQYFCQNYVRECKKIISIVVEFYNFFNTTAISEINFNPHHPRMPWLKNILP